MINHPVYIIELAQCVGNDLRNEWMNEDSQIKTYVFGRMVSENRRGYKITND